MVEFLSYMTEEPSQLHYWELFMFYSLLKKYNYFGDN